jgi:D-alanine-D-alanine ligase
MTTQNSQNETLKIGVVFGSPSAEHEVSLAGAESVLKAFTQLDDYTAMPIGIDKDGKWYTGETAWPSLVEQADKDMLFVQNPDVSNATKTMGTEVPPLDYINACDYIMLIIPGKYGEDGNLQGFFATLGKQIIGCDVLASALCFDKAMVKATLADYGYEVAPGVDVKLGETEITPALYDKICDELGTHKLVLKPTDNGSSIGLSQAENAKEFEKGMALAAKYTNHVVVEKFIPHKEIVVGVIGEGNDLLISDLGQSNEADDHVYYYEEKYINNDPCIVPAPLSDDMTAEIKRLTGEIYNITKCSGWARVDFLIEKDTNKIYMNEINTVPGMSEPSVFPRVFKDMGYDYPKLIRTIVEKAITPKTLKKAA